MKRVFSYLPLQTDLAVEARRRDALRRRVWNWWLNAVVGMGLVFGWVVVGMKMLELLAR